MQQLVSCHHLSGFQTISDGPMWANSSQSQVQPQFLKAINNQITSFQPSVPWCTMAHHCNTSPYFKKIKTWVLNADSGRFVHACPHSRPHWSHRAHLPKIPSVLNLGAPKWTHQLRQWKRAFEVSMKAGSQTIEPCQQSLGIQKSKDVFTEMKMVFLHRSFHTISFFGNVVGTPWDLVPSKQLSG